MRRLRDHGRVGKYEHVELGWAYRLDALQAAILGAKLPHLEAWTAARRAAAQRYNELLADTDVVTPVERPYNRHVYHCYVIRSPRRDALAAHLASQGIGTGGALPDPDAPAAGLSAHGPGTGQLSRSPRPPREQVLSLPMFPEITPEQQERVAERGADVSGRRRGEYEWLIGFEADRHVTGRHWIASGSPPQHESACYSVRACAGAG